MQIKQLEYFVMVCESKSMNEAAEKLYITQPTLSASIASLEKELGIRLLQRTNKGVLLTEEGKEFLSDCHAIIEITSTWQGRYKKNAKTLKIKATPIIGNTVIAEAIVKIKNKYPDILFELEETMVPTPQNKPKKTEFISIGLYETNDVESIIYFANKNGWHVEKIYNGNTFAFVNANSGLAKKDSIRIDDLSGYIIATYPNFEKDFPYGTVLESLKKQNHQSFTTKESQFKAIAKNPNYIGIFSELVIQNNYKNAQNIIKAIPIVEPLLPITVLLFQPEKNHFGEIENETLNLIKHNINELRYIK